MCDAVVILSKELRPYRTLRRTCRMLWQRTALQNITTKTVWPMTRLIIALNVPTSRSLRIIMVQALLHLLNSLISMFKTSSARSWTNIRDTAWGALRWLSMSTKDNKSDYLRMASLYIYPWGSKCPVTVPISYLREVSGAQAPWLAWLSTVEVDRQSSRKVTQEACCRLFCQVNRSETLKRQRIWFQEALEPAQILPSNRPDCRWTTPLL